MKYWNPRRIARVRERERRKRTKEYDRSVEASEARRRHARGNGPRNARLIFDALGSMARRHMLMRLHEKGEMSLSNLVETLELTLPSALEHLDALERANLVTTRKQGRLRLCAYNPAAFKELSVFLSSSRWQFEE